MINAFTRGILLGLLLAGGLLFGQAKKPTPADGHDIHVVAPHVVEGKVMGPYHHYCKSVSDTVLECLIYESTDPKALMVWRGETSASLRP